MYPQEVIDLTLKHKTQELLARVVKKSLSLTSYQRESIVLSRYRMILRILSETSPQERSQVLREETKNLVLGYRELRKR